MIVSGTGRCGTAWLAQALNDGTDAVVEHEAANVERWPGGWQRWMALDAPVVGNVDGSARYRFFALDADLPEDTQWLFLLREPLAWVRSLATRYKDRYPKPTLMGAAAFIFGGCEVALFELSRLGIKPDPWMMEHVVTPEGFGALCAALDLEIKPGFTLPPVTNETTDWRGVKPVADWPEHIRETIEDLPERGLRLRTVYRKARKRKEQ